MKTEFFSLIKYEAEDGMVFDWVNPRFIQDEEGNEIQEHLYAKILFIGGNDDIENYIEVIAPEMEA
jgi:hypothetical protein